MSITAINQSARVNLAVNQGQDLFLAWQVLRNEQPRLRARDAAQHLGVSEAELLACRVGEDAVRLRPDWQAVTRLDRRWARVMVLTRNEHCVHERHGYYRETTVMANGKMGLVVSADIDLRLFLSGWKSAFALSEDTKRGYPAQPAVFSMGKGWRCIKCF